MHYFTDINKWLYSDFPYDLHVGEIERQYFQSTRYRTYTDRMALHSVSLDISTKDDPPDIFE